MSAAKTTAVLLRAGIPVGWCETARRGGEVVAYGWKTYGGALLETGRAKISKARKYVDDPELLDTLEHALINNGGGPVES